MTTHMNPLNRTVLALPAAALLALAGCLAAPPPRADDIIFGPFEQRAVLGADETLAPEELKRKPTVPEKGPIELTIIEAVLVGLENNRALLVERRTPAIVQTFEDQELAVFDPVLSAELLAADASARTAAGADTSTTTFGAGAGFAKRFATGTDVGLGVTADQTRGAGSLNAVLGGLSITQALLRGLGTAVNLADLRQARLDTLMSQYELRGFAEALAAEIESTCWDYYLAERQIEIVEQSLKLARQQLQEAEQRVNVGRLAETDLAAARAEVALRQEALINARSLLDTARLRLLRLTNPPGQGLWDRELVLKASPTIPPTKSDDVEDRAKLAMKMRPDLNEARLRVERGDLAIVKTRNGLLPKLDLFVSLGKTGYADSFGVAAGRIDDKYYDVSVGLALKVPFGNRKARAEHRRAMLTREQLAAAVGNLEQLIQVDVRTASIEVNRGAEQVTATTATRKAQEEKARAESEKFRVGKSTSILVATAQRDLVVSQIAEIHAAVNYLKALIAIHRLDGSLLLRRGIVAPGREPPPMSRRVSTKIVP